MKFFESLCRPKLGNLLKDELYQTEREILGLDEQIYRYKIALRKAEATLLCALERKELLQTQLNPGPTFTPGEHTAEVAITAIGQGGGGGAKADL